MEDVYYICRQKMLVTFLKPFWGRSGTGVHTQSFASLQGVVAGVFPTRLLGKGFLTAFGMMQGKTKRISESRTFPFGKRKESANLGHFLSESEKNQRILDISFWKAKRISESWTFPFGKRKESANLGHFLSESDKIQRILDISFRKATRISESRTFPFGKRKDSANLGQISTKKNINHLKLYVI